MSGATAPTSPGPTSAGGDEAADLRGRLAALRDAAALLDRHGVTADVDVDGLLAHAEGRLRHGTDRTVVALAGGTGSGKSSLLNALAGTPVARSGVTRPTTSVAQAVVFGRPADALLDHIGVPRRHLLEDPDDALDGLVVLDLPDFDSVAEAHRREVDRLVGLVDLLVWVTDPQKYADQALHDGYLRPLAGHADVVEVVLNKVDLLDAEERRACLADLRRLLLADGLPDPTPLEVSATTGEGLDALTGLLAAEVRARQAVVDRLSADVREAAIELSAAAGEGMPSPDALADDLVDGLVLAAGVPDVAALVAAQHRRDAALRTGWPPVRWVRRLRRAPLTRLRTTAGSTVARAEVSRTLRRTGETLSSAAAGGVQEAGVATVRQAVDPLVEALDTQVSRRTQQLRQPPRWWSAVGTVQTLLIAVAAVAGVWLLGLALADSFLRLDVEALSPTVGDVPVPTALLLGGLVAGLLLAVLSGLLARVGARRRARRAVAQLREGVAVSAEAVVLDPLRVLQADAETWRALLDRAAGR